jgi:hypothetical protein
MKKKYKECYWCEKATYTQSLIWSAKNYGRTVEQQNAIYCLSDRNFHPKQHICSLFIEREGELKQ